MQKPVLGIILGIGILIWGFFSYPVFIQIKNYASFTSSIKPNFVQWEAVAIHDELWRLKAHYNYTVNQKTFEKSEMFLEGRYRNPYAAKRAAEEFGAVYNQVWYENVNPENASLEKFFPTKKLIYTFLSFTLLIYGFFLGSYISSRILT